MALGALSLLACAVPLDREVVVFVFGFASVRCRHSLRPCPSVPACCVFVCLGVVVWMDVSCSYLDGLVGVGAEPSVAWSVGLRLVGKGGKA